MTQEQIDTIMAGTMQTRPAKQRKPEQLKTPQDVICHQHAVITEAIALLQSQLDKMPCPNENTTWGAVSAASQASDCAKVVIESFG